MFAFSLGREFKLSIAEILMLLGPQSEKKIASVSDRILIVRDISEEVARRVFEKCGGSIRLLRIEKTIRKQDFLIEAEKMIRERAEIKGSKFSFALASFGEPMRLAEASLKIKKALAKEGFSIRTANQKDENINAASFKKDRLSETLGEIAYIKMEAGEYFATTLLCQDIDAFAGRDLGKGRDMVVGMLPPKLARMMVNLATGNDGIEGGIKTETLIDPFVGLGTVLVEAADLGYRKLVGSDLNPKMAETSDNALSDFRERSNHDFSFETFELDAREISVYGDRLSRANITTEGYLGEILSQKTINPTRVTEQKKRLISIYEGFFGGLSRSKFQGNIVISFPFWDINGKYFFFEEIYSVITKAGFEIVRLLPDGLPFGATRTGSLLYRRPGQTVGREIVKIVRKK